MTVLAANNWPTNGHLIADVAKLYLTDVYSVLDPTYGEGVWWSVWQPPKLVKHDKKLDGTDFRDLLYPTEHFDCVAFDPPYKLNGTDEGEGERYGVATPMRWQDKMQMILEGIDECARITSNILLLKCQDQVCSGKVVWQTDLFTDRARHNGLTKIDRFDYYGGYRPQPMEGRRQRHAHGRGSTLLVFQKGLTGR